MTTSIASNRPTPTCDLPESAITLASPNTAVWDRVWKHQPADARDDELIARERRSARWSLFVEYMGEHFGSITGLRTIELGSGRGDLSALLAQEGADVTLLDASEKALAQARHRFKRLGLRANFIKGNIFSWQGGASCDFDVALSSGVIEHFVEQTRTDIIDAHRRAVRPGGMVVISVPHAHCLPYRLWKSYLQLRGWWPYGLEIPYSRRELVRRAKEAGLTDPRGHCVEFWHSVSANLIKPFLKIPVDWMGRRSVWDSVMGSTLVLFARREACPE